MQNEDIIINDLPLKKSVKDTDLLVIQDEYDTMAISPKDLMASKADKDSLSTVALTGDYSDLKTKPVIPGKTSELINDSGFLTQHQDISGKLNTNELAPKLFEVDFGATNAGKLFRVKSDGKLEFVNIKTVIENIDFGVEKANKTLKFDENGHLTIA